MDAPVNLQWPDEYPTKITLVSMQGPFWLAAKCRRKECPIEHAPFECPFQKPCAEVQPGDWDRVSSYDVEEEDNGQNS